MKQSTGRRSSYDRPIFYVVTRDGRRAWHKDYWTLSEAQDHADTISNSLRILKDKGYRRVVIVETDEPEKIT